MSVAAAASPASAPAAAPVTPGQGTKAASPAAVTGQEKTGSAQPAKEALAATVVEDELEEIKIGSISGKIPKAIAKAVKDLERGFHSKSQESAAKDRDFQALAKAFKENPDIGFKVFGVDPDQYSQTRMAKYLEDQMMSPEQKKLKQLEDENKTFKQRQEEAKKKQDQEQLSAAELKEEREIQSSLMKAWQHAFPLSEGDAPDPWIGQKIVATFAAAQDQELGWTWEQCADRVKKELETADKRRLSKMPLEVIRELLGPEVLKKLRDDDVRRVTDKASEAAAKRANQSASPGEKPQKPASPKKNFEGRKVVTQDEWDAAFSTE